MFFGFDMPTNINLQDSGDEVQNLNATILIYRGIGKIQARSMEYMV